MKPQTLVMLVVALGCGVAAMVMTQRLLPGGERKDNTVSVLVVTKEIPAGMTIDEQSVKTIDYPKEMVPPDAIKSMDDLKDRSAKYQMVSDEIIREVKLAPKGTHALSAIVAPGFRAVAVGIQTSSAVAGFVKPNSHVDIYMTVPARDRSPTFSKVVLKNIKVLAVNTEMMAASDAENRGKVVETVTFELTPEQTQLITLAQRIGTLSLALRGAGDDPADENVKVITESDLLGSNAEKFAKTAEEKQPETIIAKDDRPKEAGFFEKLAKIAADAKKPEVNTETAPPAEDKQEEPKTTVVAKKQKKLVYTDLHGNVVMEVMLDDDSKYMNSLKEFIREEETGQPVTDPKATAPKAAQPTTPRRKKT